MIRRLDPSIRHVACIGLMAAGKSSVGGILAEELGWPFVDVDDEIEARTGKTVAELAYEGGEAAFRPWERRIVLEVLEDDAPSVLAAPGGIALDPEAREAIGSLDVAAIYLRADPKTLAVRVEEDEDHDRPLVGEDPLTALVEMFRERDATYRALADIEVEVDGRTREEVADLVLTALTSDGVSPPRPLP